jgi:hypothetical protein
MEKQTEILFIINNELYNFLDENFEDIPRYIEYLIYKDIKENNILINDTI